MRCATLRRPLAALLAAMSGVCAPVAYANIVPVTNCDDAGAGSLRAAVASAVSGDTIEAGDLQCGTISLHTGAINIDQVDLAFDGPGIDRLQISGKYQYQVFNHRGSGILAVQHVSLAGGYVYSSTGSALGGCVYSAGNVELVDVSVSHCTAKSQSGDARGGGIYARGFVRADFSTINANMANSTNGPALAGGLFARSDFSSLSYSTLADNQALGALGFGGGLTSSAGQFYVKNSTISGNSASTSAGGAFLGARVSQNQSHYQGSIIDSTISGNHAQHGGGLYTTIPTQVIDSTIAFNTADSGQYSGAFFAPGLTAVGGPNPITLTLTNALIANNTYGANLLENDFSTAGGAASAVTVSGTNNLIRVATGSVPDGTLSGVCPLLKPLRDNGGATRTHALSSTSPAIDRGNNDNFDPIIQVQMVGDQRGSARQSGANTDIGAFEVDQNDMVFDSGFDGCP